MKKKAPGVLLHIVETHKLAKTWTFVAFELHLACVDLKKKLEWGRGWRFRGLVLVIYYINLTCLIFQGRGGV